MMAISAELLVGMLALPAIAAASSLPAAIENQDARSCRRTRRSAVGLECGIRDQENSGSDLASRESASGRGERRETRREMDRSIKRLCPAASMDRIV